MQIGFDSALYMEKQTKYILERIGMFGDKLYLEFGGKLFDDFHAARVLPGFDVNGKIKLLNKLKENAEIIFCINANHIEKNKLRSDIGITYDMDVFRLIDKISSLGLLINSVVITQYTDQPGADMFRKKCEMNGVKTYIHRPIKGYPTDIDLVVSDKGYGANSFVETTKPLIIVTAPGPCSGKLGTCLSQLYHENKRNVKAGYAKFETFPIWNLPLKHPVNLAYEAATADLKDVNMIDHFHLDAYGEKTVNYNRDIEMFPIIRTILEKVTGNSEIYRSPTDMGVNMAGYCIYDDDIVQEAARQEIIRRYFKARCDYKMGRVDIDTAQRIEIIMQELDIKTSDRSVVEVANIKAEACGMPSIAIKLQNGKFVTGRASELMTAAASVFMNAIKEMSNIKDELHLLSPFVIEPILKIKRDLYGISNPVLNLKEVLIALSICEMDNQAIVVAMARMHELHRCEAHSTCFLTATDEEVFRSLGINLTNDAEFPTKDLYYV